MKKVLIIIAAIVLTAGLVLFAVALFASGFDITRFVSAKYETNTYTVDEVFDKIEIFTKGTDIDFKLSNDGKFRVTCEEREKVKHSLTVEEGVLKITVCDEGEWTDYVSLFSRSLSMTVYLPSESYESLSVVNDTGDVSISDSFSFGNVDLEVSTGKTVCNATLDGSLKIKTSTGDVSIKASNARNIEVSVSTGNVTIENNVCTEKVSVVSGTGKTTIIDLSCRELFVKGSNGRRTLKNVIVENDMRIENGTGDVYLDACDGGNIFVKTSTGDVKGTVLSEKIFVAHTSTGKVLVPDPTSGGKCEITTSTGNIEIRLS